jgi:hypothetical protein
MKKLMLAATLMIGFISFLNAQTVKTPAPVAKTKVSKQPTVAKTIKEPVANTVVAKPTVKSKEVAPAKTTNAQGVVLKSDGTPDKRYKTAAPAAKGPLKKDGTPDLRYKENKKPKS